MTRRREIELVSPMDFAEVTRACRVSATLIAECEVCGRAMRGGVHLSDIARAGFLCADCCPACNGSVALSDVEVEAMKRNWHSETMKVPRVRGLITAPPRLPGPKSSVHYSDGDVVQRIECSMRFRADGKNGTMVALVEDAGGAVAWGELARRSPWPEYETFLIVRRLEREFKAVSVERVG